MITNHRSSAQKWAVLGLLVAAYLLDMTFLSACSSIFATDNGLAYLSVIDGDVKVSDGITDTAAEKGVLTPRNSRTLLKTGKGYAILKTPDGSFVILDSDSKIEFNRQPEDDSGKSFVFNLVSGRAMVVNGQDSQLPIQVFVGGHITAQVFRAVMGLEVKADSNVQERVDCLAGRCQVGGTYELLSGQNAQISQNSAVNITSGVAYETWQSLVSASKPGSALLNLFAGIFPTITPTISPSASPEPVTQAIPTTRTSTSTSSPQPSSTPTFTPTLTPTSTIKPLAPYFTLTPTPTQKAKRRISPPHQAPTNTLSPPTLPPPPITVLTLSADLH